MDTPRIHDPRVQDTGPLSHGSGTGEGEYLSHPVGEGGDLLVYLQRHFDSFRLETSGSRPVLPDGTSVRE